MLRNNQYADAFTKFKKNGDKEQLISKLKEVIEEDMAKPARQPLIQQADSNQMMKINPQ